MPPIELAAISARKKVLDLLVLAFAADPFERWMYPNLQEYLEKYPLFLNVLTAQSFAAGQVYLTADGAGAAVWLPPGIQLDDDAIIEIHERTVDPRKHATMNAMIEQLAGCYPREPYWYLDILGVDPARQGQGLGAALLQHTLAQCDREHMPAYLESTNPKNFSLYQRHGFELVGRVQVGDAPPMFPMLRQAR